ncbi:YraN family protein [Corallincola platygyrae]|uniref:UPF0102 protein ACFSJ3_16215 n=1 Tax=Corallincola platygyrae TaxID=1193278 RepID=A0ABW4XQV3_9GAMM
MKWRRNHRAVGEAHEQNARKYLERQGLSFVTANFHCRGGEIDLVMRDKDTWVFVEVKYRQSDHFGGSISAVNGQKAAKLVHSVRVYLQQHKMNENVTPCRIDVVAITGDQYEWIQNAI